MHRGLAGRICTYLLEIVMLNVFVFVWLVGFELSPTDTAKLKVPVLVGVPEIVPVEAPSFRPSGSAPEVIVQV